MTHVGYGEAPCLDAPIAPHVTNHPMMQLRAGVPALSLLFAVTLRLPAVAAQSLPPKAEVNVVGTVHVPTAMYPAESLAAIIARVKPDMILMELDGSFFD